MHHGPDRIVMVTGASRGIGANVALRLAAPGTHVIVSHRYDAANADTVAAAIRDAGGSASTLAADICDAGDAAAMMDIVATRFGRLDVLVLNTSGMDSDADPGSAMRLNRDAQRRLAELAVPLLPAGGHIVYVTSHQAHFFPLKAVPKGYAGIAASKRAGETALYGMRTDLAHAGIHLTVVSGDRIDGPSVSPRVDGLAEAVVGVTTAEHPSNIVFVGKADYLMTA
ncbi:SDR family oxidoreductase [Mycobacterium sp. GA-2829]|uniref:SDR family oxidoreductase n=1 Tax=Mycobacterium sp. GA-2829 TaxID=1772283 RepID=UPI00073FC0AC|nr:SDR family oxidoreductase [Mycobacterium sp. GA-2829]KUI37054.1 short-chain dehydrogenase [Mycobacterium sp. GA-2829]